MPEGPSIILLREEVSAFEGKKILRAEGTSKIDKKRLIGLRVKAFRSWGKHFLIEFPGFAIRIHFLMFGSHLVDARKDRDPRLTLGFGKRELNFYSCAVRYIEGDLDDVYDWSGDVLADGWNPRAALKKLRARPERLVCDALLDQDVFAGVGNIIKNEVLFRVRVHPLSTVGALPAAKLRSVVAQAREYSFEFLAWKRDFVLRQHWLVHNQRTCPRCRIPLVKDYLGESSRRTFYCERCQKRYGGA
jgi:endonuclease VIII